MIGGEKMDEKKFEEILERSNQKLEKRFNDTMEKNNEKLEKRFNDAMEKNNEKLEKRFNDTMEKNNEKLEKKITDSMEKRFKEIEQKRIDDNFYFEHKYWDKISIIFDKLQLNDDIKKIEDERNLKLQQKVEKNSAKLMSLDFRVSELEKNVNSKNFNR